MSYDPFNYALLIGKTATWQSRSTKEIFTGVIKKITPRPFNKITTYTATMEDGKKVNLRRLTFSEPF